MGDDKRDGVAPEVSEVVAARSRMRISALRLRSPRGPTVQAPACKLTGMKSETCACESV